MSRKTTDFIVAKVFLQIALLVTPEWKNSRVAMLTTASLLTLVAISCASLGLWRMGTDLGWTGDFVFQNGFLSHWQVWTFASVGVQYASWRLSRYARTEGSRETEIARMAEPLSRRATATV
jgi:hypothetical protein